MARSRKPAAPESASYHGEVWTDARGYATVRLPAEAGPLEPPLEYELRDLEPPRSARITAATDQPHVKVAWRVSGRPPADQTPHRQQEEG
jgi:hypothetical protein